MTSKLTLIALPMLALACLTLASCVSTGKAPTISKAPTGMHEITALYEKATAHKRRPFRKPVRDERARVCALLAQKTDAILAEAATWKSDAKLANLDDARKDEVRNAVDAFRISMADLKAAARATSVTAMRTSYAKALGSYRQLGAVTGG